MNEARYNNQEKTKQTDSLLAPLERSARTYVCTYLSTSLIDVACGIVKDSQHGHNAIAAAVGTANVRLRCPDVGNGHADSAGVLGNDGTIFERVVNSVNRIFLDAHEKARTHLRVGSARVEEGGSRVREVSLRQQVVRFNDSRNVVSVNSHRNAHEHVLGTLGDFAVRLEEVTLFQRFESKVVELKVSIVNDGGIELVAIGHDNVKRLLGNKRSRFSRLGMCVMVKGVNDFGKDFVGHFVQVGDGNAGCQDGAIGMLRGKGCRRLSGKSTQRRCSIVV